MTSSTAIRESRIPTGGKISLRTRVGMIFRKGLIVYMEMEILMKNMLKFAFPTGYFTNTKFKFRSPYRSGGNGAYFVVPDGYVNSGTVYWGNTDSCGTLRPRATVTTTTARIL